MSRIFSAILGLFRPRTLATILNQYVTLQDQLRAHAQDKLDEADRHEQVIADASYAQAAAREEHVKALQIADAVASTFLAVKG